MIRDGFFYTFALCVPQICSNFPFFIFKIIIKVIWGLCFAFAVRIMYDKNSGRSRGFGFVHFSNDHEAKVAKDAMDGKV